MKANRTMTISQVVARTGVPANHPRGVLREEPQRIDGAARVDRAHGDIDHEGHWRVVEQ